MNLFTKIIAAVSLTALSVGAIAQTTTSTTTTTVTEARYRLPVHPAKKTWLERLSIHSPRAPQVVQAPGTVHSESVSSTLDSSLLSVAYYFDRQAGNSVGGNYELFAVDVPGLPNPLELGTAVVSSGDQSLWSGASVSYKLVNHSQFSLAISLAFPGVNYVNGILSTQSKIVMYPGFYFSYKF